MPAMQWQGGSREHGVLRAKEVEKYLKPKLQEGEWGMTRTNGYIGERMGLFCVLFHNLNSSYSVVLVDWV